jgi:type II secretion system protein N
VKPELKQRLLLIGRWVAYPAFYLFCLVVFGALTFPYDQLKGRLISEFDRMQAKSRRRPGEAPMRLEIAELDGYWLTGIEVEGARLIIPPKRKRTSARGGMPLLPTGTDKGEDGKDKEPKPSVIVIDYASVRVKILPLLIGDVMVSFGVEAFGGEIDGSLPIGGDGDVDLELDGLQLSEVGPLRALVEGLPLQGVMNGAIALSPKEGKFGKADGKVELHIDDVVVADGKSEVMGVVIPAAQIGSIVFNATAQDGILTIDDFSARGQDLELLGEGKIKLHELWDRSQADIYVKFKFADSYREKSDSTKSLLGDAEGKIKPVIELDPKSPFKRAKTDDGYYRFQLSGPLGDLEPRPAGKGAATGGKRSSGRPSTRLPGLSSKMPRAGAGESDGAEEPAARPPARPAPEPAPVREAEPARPPPPPPAPPPQPEPEQQQGDDGRGDEGGDE